VFQYAGTRWISQLGSSNTFVGENSGNFTMNTGVCSFNVGIGPSACSGLTTGTFNASVGYAALQNVTSGQYNSGFGSQALNGLTSGFYNVAVGQGAGFRIQTTNGNTVVGWEALANAVSPSNNIALGNQVAINYTTTESDNIIIGNTFGTIGENRVMRLGNDGSVGSSTTSTYIQGIAGVSVSNQLNVVIDSATGQLGTNAPHVITGYVVANATPFVVGANDYYITVDTSTIAITIQLPNAPTTYRSFIIKDSAGNAFSKNVTVTTVGGAILLDGATTYVMNTNYASIQLLYDGFGYQIF
jgi:hypothetical protein